MAMPFRLARALLWAAPLLGENVVGVRGVKRKIMARLQRPGAQPDSSGKCTERQSHSSQQEAELCPNNDWFGCGSAALS